MAFSTLWIALCLTGAPPEPRTLPASDTPFTAQAFDRADLGINDGNGYKSGTASDIAWGESYIMLAYTVMYQTTGDTRYLDKLVDHADHVLAARDDARGFKDYSGRSRAGWSVAGVYTVAELTLKDAAGGEVLKFRSIPYAFNDSTRIQVITRSDEQYFDVIIDNPKWPPKEEHKHLTLDRHSPDFVEKRINACERVAIGRKLACGAKGSNLVTVQAVGDKPGLPVKDAAGAPLSAQGTAMIPIFMAYHGYSGQATCPMLQFAWIVRQDPKLKARYGSVADRYVAESAKVFVDGEENWRDGPKPGQGYYVTGPYQCPFWSDNIGTPHNYLASLGRSTLLLAQLTGEKRWQDRTERMARLIKDHLRVDEHDAYQWNYWWGQAEEGWTRENSPSFNTPVWAKQSRIEDSSHGQLEIEFAAMCARAGVVFDDRDMKRFANTFLNHMLDRQKWTFSDYIDGSGGWGTHVHVLGGWMELGTWNREVVRVGLQIGRVNKLYQKGSGVTLLTLSRLIKWSRAENAPPATQPVSRQ